MNDHRDKPYVLTLLLLGTIALSALLWWISDLTGGPENGGRYDVPAVNGAAWWGFILSIPAVLIVGGRLLSRLDERPESLDEPPTARAAEDQVVVSRNHPDGDSAPPMRGTY